MIFYRCQTGISAKKIHRYEEGAFYGRLGRVQGQEGREKRSRDVERTAHWRQEGHKMEG